MWKKTDESPEAESTDSPPPAPAGNRLPQQRMPGAVTRLGPGRGNAFASIGPTVQIKGEINGAEKLHVDGSVEGNIVIKDNEFVVGSQGRLNANVTAQSILIEGEVQGDLKADDLITLRSTAKVTGSVTAPRVVVEDGCQFKGKIEMEQTSGVSAGKGATPASSATSTDARGNASKSASGL